MRPPIWLMAWITGKSPVSVAIDSSAIAVMRLSSSASIFCCRAEASWRKPSSVVPSFSIANSGAVGRTTLITRSARQYTSCGE
jgi:hypothetical protein